MKNIVFIVFSSIIYYSCFKEQKDYPCNPHSAGLTPHEYPSATVMPACNNKYFEKVLCNIKVNSPFGFFNTLNGNLGIFQNDTISYYDSTGAFVIYRKMDFQVKSIFYQKGNYIWFNSDKIYEIDSIGNLINTINASSDEKVVLITNNTGFVTNINNSNILRKYNFSGALEWTLDSLCPSGGSSYFNILYNGDILWVHKDKVSSSNDSVYFSIIRIGLNKVVRWQKNYFFKSATDDFKSFSNKNNITILGNHGDILIIDSIGIEILKKHYDNLIFFQSSSYIYRLNDDSFIQLNAAQTSTNSYSISIFYNVTKFDQSGQIIWKKYSLQNLNGFEYYLKYTYQTTSNDIFLAGVLYVYDGKHCDPVSWNVLLSKTDPEGNTCY